MKQLIEVKTMLSETANKLNPGDRNLFEIPRYDYSIGSIRGIFDKMKRNGELPCHVKFVQSGTNLYLTSIRADRELISEICRDVNNNKVCNMALLKDIQSGYIRFCVSTYNHKNGTNLGYRNGVIVRKSTNSEIQRLTDRLNKLRNESRN